MYDEVALGLADEKVEEIELEKFDADMNADELYRVCEDQQEKIIDLHEQCQRLKQDLRDEVGEKEDAIYSRDQWFQQNTDTNAKMEKMENQAATNRERLSVTLADVNAREVQMGHTRQVIAQRRYRRNKILAKYDVQTMNAQDLDLERKVFSAWRAYTMVNVSLNKGAGELLKLRREMEDMTLKLRDTEETVEILTDKNAKLAQKCKAAGLRILRKYGVRSEADLKSDSVSAWKDFFDVARLERLYEESQNKIEELTDTVATRDATIAERDAYINKLEHHIGEVDKTLENTRMANEDNWAHMTVDALNRRCEAVDAAIVTEREEKARMQADLERAFQLERLDYERDIKQYYLYSINFIDCTENSKFDLFLTDFHGGPICLNK